MVNSRWLDSITVQYNIICNGGIIAQDRLQRHFWYQVYHISDCNGITFPKNQYNSLGMPIEQVVIADIMVD